MPNRQQKFLQTSFFLTSDAYWFLTYREPDAITIVHETRASSISHVAAPVTGQGVDGESIGGGDT